MMVQANVQSSLVDSVSALEQLGRWSNLLTRVGKIELDLPGLTTAEKLRYEDLIRNYTNVCGCEQGRIFLATLLIGYFIYLYARPQGLRGASWTEFGIGVALACLGAMLGKVYGLLSARRKLRFVIAELRQRTQGCDLS